MIAWAAALLGRYLQPLLVFGLAVTISAVVGQTLRLRTVQLELVNVRQQHADVERARAQTALAAFRASERESARTAAAYEVDRAGIARVLERKDRALSQALRRPPPACPATVGECIVPAALGVRLRAIRAGAGDPAASPASGGVAR